MNNPLTIEELASIHTLMQSMLLAAESGDWQAIGELDAQRRALILNNEGTVEKNQGRTSDFIAATDQAKQLYAARCNEIQSLDAKITKTVLDAKQKLVIENRNMRNQIVAKKGYAQTASMTRSF